MSSHFDVDAFHYRSTLDDGELSEVSGFELRWRLAGRRSSFRVAVPAITLNGAPGVVVLGPGYSLATGGRRAGGGSSEQGPGGGPGGPAQRAAPEVMPPIVTASTGRESGIGDVRLSLSHYLGEDAPFGRFRVLGGVKLPTADESRGLGTGETDLWAGFGWRREGWVTNGELYLTWVELGDPNGFVLQDGPAAGGFLDWPLGRGGLRTGLEAARAPIAGDPTRLRAVAGGYGMMGRTAGWDVELLVGLSDSAADFGLAAAILF